MRAPSVAALARHRSKHIRQSLHVIEVALGGALDRASCVVVWSDCLGVDVDSSMQVRVAVRFKRAELSCVCIECPTNSHAPNHRAS